MNTEDAIAQQLVAELRGLTAPMELILHPATVFQLTALVQLALRHPHVGLDTRATGDRFVAAVLGYFADCPIALDLVRRGNAPKEDR